MLASDIVDWNFIAIGKCNDKFKKSYINNFEQRGKVRVVSLFAEVEVDSTNRIFSDNISS